jgi:hypothetical protein
MILRMVKRQWTRKISRKKKCSTYYSDLGKIRERSERQTSKFLAWRNGYIVLAETLVENTGLQF